MWNFPACYYSCLFCFHSAQAIQNLCFASVIHMEVNIRFLAIERTPERVCARSAISAGMSGVLKNSPFTANNCHLYVQYLVHTQIYYNQRDRKVQKKLEDIW